MHVIPPLTTIYRERLAISLEDESLRDFSIKIKQDKVGIEEFCETFNKRIFQACPFVEFNVDVIYMKEALVSKELVSRLKLFKHTICLENEQAT